MFDVVGEDLGVIRLLFDVFQLVRIVPCSHSFTVILLRLGGRVLVWSLIKTK